MIWIGDFYIGKKKYNDFYKPSLRQDQDLCMFFGQLLNDHGWQTDPCFCIAMVVVTIENCL